MSSVLPSSVLTILAVLVKESAFDVVSSFATPAAQTLHANLQCGTEANLPSNCTAKVSLTSGFPARRRHEGVAPWEWRDQTHVSGCTLMTCDRFPGYFLRQSRRSLTVSISPIVCYSAECYRGRHKWFLTIASLASCLSSSLHL